MAKGKPTHVIKIEKLGRLHVWTMRTVPAFSGATRNAQRKAYEEGFRVRTQDFLHAEVRTEPPPPTLKRRGLTAVAWWQGYQAALAQEDAAPTA